MNSVNLIGRLCRDVEARTVCKGEKAVFVAYFMLAVDRVGSEEADFIRCVAFGKTAEFAKKYFGKGNRVGVSGRIQTGSYETKDGDTRYATDVIVERMTFADAKREESDEESPARPQEGSI